MARQEDERPQAENHLDLAEEVEQFGDDAWRGRTSLPAIRRVMSVLQPMGRRGHADAAKVWAIANKKMAVAIPLKGSSAIRASHVCVSPAPTRSDSRPAISGAHRRGDGVSHLPTSPHGTRRAGHLPTAVMSADAPATRPTG